jgi:hypothetical protein
MRWVLATAVALATPQAVVAQIADRVAAAEDGVVRFGYETREGVEICDQGIRMGERRLWWRSRHGERGASSCREGLAQVELTVRDGRVRDVELVGDPSEADAGALDLGTVPAAEAARFLLSLAHDGGASRDAAEDAVFPAVIADVPEVWRDLLAIARDRAVHGDVRESALFWLGQEAADAATAGLSGVALDQDEDQDVREAAIFALSQRPVDEAVPALIEVALTGDELGTRRTAMFWLAQSEDPRVVDFFEQVLLGRIR